jgi:membrane associated rhomboid family serine protease
MRFLKRIQYNSPVVLTFAGVSLIALILGYVTGGAVNTLLFSVYRSSPLNPLTYVRLFCHVLGHANYQHYIGNMLMILVIGPVLEEKYGSRSLLRAILITAVVSGLVQIIFFPSTAILGASGIVFMMIVLSSLAGAQEGRIPLTLILVVIFYIGGEVINGVFQQDNISQMAHIIGGLCGAVIGFILEKGRRRRPAI